jgi:hypothetical protein
MWALENSVSHVGRAAPVTKRLRNKTSPGQFCNGPDKLP